MPNCVNCGDWAGEERWRTLCKPCFIKQKKREELEIEEALEASRKENAELRIALRQQPKANTIPADKLKILIQLCHPDKHNGSKIANEITQWLLKLRKEKK